jgi:kynurenine formamidase
MGTSTLAQLAAGLSTGRIRVVDLTQTLAPEFPQIVLPPEFGQARPFRIDEVSRYDERGPAWYWNNFSCGEHTGTHFDAPIHWISGRDLPNNATDTIPVQELIGAACVLDCSREAAADPDFLLTVAFVRRWERRHGRIPPRSWVLMRTDWSKRRDPVAYQNFDETGQHTPGPDAAVVRFLVEERDVIGFGSESIGTDAGQGLHLKPPYPCHYYMHGNGRYGLQCLTNLDQLPPTGAVVVCPPLKIRQGSGSPLRVLALIEQPPAPLPRTRSTARVNKARRLRSA